MKKFHKINEAETETPAPTESETKPDNTGTKLNIETAVTLPYSTFVKQLGSLASDEKLQAVINAGKEDGKTEDESFEMSEVDFDVKILKPLQNEIDMDNSLMFPLAGKSKELESILKGEPVKILGPVVVFQTNGVDYIIDGHHRWSCVYGLNKDGKVKGIRLKSKTKVDPTRILKAAQIAIASIMKEVPSSPAKGVNLLTISEDVLKNYVKTGEGSLKGFKGLQEDVINRFKSVKSELDSVDKIADFIWQNILSMKKTSGELWKKLNIPREVMPQTDQGAEGPAKDAKTRETVAKLASGTVNFLPPFESKIIKTFEGFMSKRKKGKINKN